MSDRPRTSPLEETLTIDLPAPVGRLTLQADNAAFSTFRRVTRARGLGPLGPNGRPAGIDLRDPGDRDHPEESPWAHLDYESVPLLLHTLAEAQHPRLALRQLENVCTPRVQAEVIEPVTQYLLRVLKPMLLAAERNGTDPEDPTDARRTPTSSSGRSGPTP